MAKRVGAKEAPAIVQRKTRVLDFDLRAYFDNVRHDRLLAKVAQRVDDAEVMHRRAGGVALHANPGRPVRGWRPRRRAGRDRPTARGLPDLDMPPDQARLDAATTARVAPRRGASAGWHAVPAGSWDGAVEPGRSNTAPGKESQEGARGARRCRAAVPAPVYGLLPDELGHPQHGQTAPIGGTRPGTGRDKAPYGGQVAQLRSIGRPDHVA